MACRPAPSAPPIASAAYKRCSRTSTATRYCASSPSVLPPRILRCTPSCQGRLTFSKTDGVVLTPPELYARRSQVAHAEQTLRVDQGVWRVTLNQDALLSGQAGCPWALMSFCEADLDQKVVLASPRELTIRCVIWWRSANPWAVALTLFRWQTAPATPPSLRSRSSTTAS